MDIELNLCLGSKILKGKTLCRLMGQTRWIVSGYELMDGDRWQHHVKGQL